MSKVLVRKAERPMMMVGGGDGKIMFPVGSSRESRLPDDREDGVQLSGTDLDAARLAGKEAAQQLAGFKHPNEIQDTDVKARLQHERAKRKVAIDRAKPQSYREKYAGDAAGRFLNRQVGVRRSGEVTPEDEERVNQRAAAAGKVGVMGRKFGRGLAGALGGLSFLTGLESAGAAGQGFEQGLGSAAFRAQTTYGQTAPELADIGGEAGARIGAGGVGVRHRLQDRAAARADARAARQPVAVAEPTAPQTGPVPQPPLHAPLTDVERAALESKQSRIEEALSYNLQGTLPNLENDLVRVKRQLNRGTSGLPFDMRGGAYNTNVFEPVPQFDPTSQAPDTPAGQTQLPDAPVAVAQTAPPTTATTATPPIPTTPQGMMTGLFGQNEEEEKIADPTVGVKGAEAGAALAEKFSGKRQSMSDMEVEE